MAENKITYADIEKANSEIKTTDVKGKDYAEVNERVIAFRKLYPQGSITTEIVVLDKGLCVIKATAIGEKGEILGTGTAYEKEGSTFINKTSYIENCETSAVGRALGFAGFGIACSIASAEEVANAIVQQNAPQQKPQNAPQRQKSGGNVDYRLMLINELKSRNININAYAKEKKINGATTAERYIELLRELGVEI